MWCELARREWLGIVPEVLVRLRRPGRLTSNAAAEQERLAQDVLREHMTELTGKEWSKEEVAALRPGSRVPSGIQLAALKRWERSMQQEHAISRRERGELARLGRGRRWDILRRELRRGPSTASLRTIVEAGRGIVAPGSS